MKTYPLALDLKKVRVYPLSERESLSSIDKLLIDPKAPPPRLTPELEMAIQNCARNLQSARRRNASVILMYGAHLIKNGEIGRAHV